MIFSSVLCIVLQPNSAPAKILIVGLGFLRSCNKVSGSLDWNVDYRLHVPGGRLRLTLDSLGLFRATAQIFQVFPVGHCCQFY